jgi:hypothetical protein
MRRWCGLSSAGCAEQQPASATARLVDAGAQHPLLCGGEPRLGQLTAVLLKSHGPSDAADVGQPMARCGQRFIAEHPGAEAA